MKFVLVILNRRVLYLLQKKIIISFARIIVQGKLFVRVGHKTIGSQPDILLRYMVQCWDSQLPMVKLNPFCPAR